MFIDLAFDAQKEGRNACAVLAGSFQNLKHLKVHTSVERSSLLPHLNSQQVHELHGALRQRVGLRCRQLLSRRSSRCR